MGRISSKKLKVAHTLISSFHMQNKSLTFDVPSMLQYCLENDLRSILKQKRFTEREIDQIIQNSEFYTFPQKTGLNKVKFNFNYKDFNSFQNSFICTNI